MHQAPRDIPENRLRPGLRFVSTARIIHQSHIYRIVEKGLMYTTGHPSRTMQEFIFHNDNNDEEQIVMSIMCTRVCPE